MLDKGEFGRHPYPIGDYWEEENGVKTRIIRDDKCIQQWTATLLTVDAAREKITTMREEKVTVWYNIVI